jgi:hypothetical protein
MPWPTFDIHGILAAIHRDLGWIKGQLAANTERLDRIEIRVDQQRQRWTWQDVQPWVVGAIILGSAASGKLESVLGLLAR